MFSSLGDIVCTSIIEIVDIFNVCLGAYWKFRLKPGEGGGGALICRVGALSIFERGAS